MRFEGVSLFSKFQRGFLKFFLQNEKREDLRGV